MLDPELSAIIPAFIQEAIRLSLENSITYLFLIGAMIVAFSLITSVLIRKVPLKSAEEYYSKGHEELMDISGGDAKGTKVLAAEVPDE